MISWDFMRYVFFFWLKFDFNTMSKGFLFLFFPTTIQVYFRFRKPRRRWRKCPVFQPFAIFLEVAIEPSRTDLKTFLLHNHHLKKNGSLDNKNADWINEHRDSIMGNQMGMNFGQILPMRRDIFTTVLTACACGQQWHVLNHRWCESPSEQPAITNSERPVYRCRTSLPFYPQWCQ